jgi:hypothetical protein
MTVRRTSRILGAMEQLTTSGPTVFYAPEDRDDAHLAADACDTAVAFLAGTWGLQTPTGCRVYVVTDGRGFVTGSAPPAWRTILTVTRPLWSRNLAKTWRFSGGLSQQYGNRWVIGVKPVRMLRVTDPGVQHRLFVGEEPEQRLNHVVSHELTHAATGRSRLPEWLNEGMAMLAVDRCLGVDTVRAETIDLLARRPRSHERKHPVDMALREFVQGYWATRHLDETRPGLLRDALETAAPGKVEPALAAALDVDPGALLAHLTSAAHQHYA